MYKRQVHELQNKMSDETKRADKADFECKRAQEKLAALQREKEVRQNYWGDSYKINTECSWFYSLKTKGNCNLCMKISAVRNFITATRNVTFVSLHSTYITDSMCCDCDACRELWQRGTHWRRWMKRWSVLSSSMLKEGNPQTSHKPQGWRCCPCPQKSSKLFP